MDMDKGQSAEVAEWRSVLQLQKKEKHRTAEARTGSQVRAHLPLRLRDTPRQDTMLERGPQWIQRFWQEIPGSWTSKTNLSLSSS
jgi:hypothetical protein